MRTQTLTTPAGECLVVLPEADYKRLLAAAEDNADRAAVADFRHKLAVGEEELIPSAIVDRLLSGENRIRVWREYRGLTVKSLADRANLAQSFVSQIETGRRDGTIDTIRTLADILRVTIDDLVSPVDASEDGLASS